VQGRPQPILILNPVTDDTFAHRALDLAQKQPTPASLQAALRDLYPAAVVRVRGLADEAEAWYVYRDGHWIPSRGAEPGG
jgi:hypothetical protein